MLQLLGDLLPYAVPVALSPLPIIAAVMLLLAPVGAVGGLAFPTGRVAALAGLAFVVALAAAQVAGPSEAADRGGWLRIGIGCLLMLGAGAIGWRRLRAAADAPPPGWMRSIERAGPGRALGYGLLLTVANLKEMALVIGAGLIVGAASMPPGRALAVSLLFAGVAAAGVATPLAWTLAAPESSRDGLGAARDWLVRNNAIVMAAVLLVLGAMLIGSGLESL
jgi:hypothetical protein